MAHRYRAGGGLIYPQPRVQETAGGTPPSAGLDHELALAVAEIDGSSSCSRFGMLTMVLKMQRLSAVEIVGTQLGCCHDKYRERSTL